MKVGDHVRNRDIKTCFENVTFQIKDVFTIKKVKNALTWTYVIEDLNGAEIFGTFYKK